jgi:hypothetical protein
MRLHRVLAAIGIAALERFENDDVLVDRLFQRAGQPHRQVAHAQDFIHRVLQNGPCRREAADLGDLMVKRAVDDDIFDEVGRVQRRDLPIDQIA